MCIIDSHKQDVFALLANGFKRDGFFVEFGAAGGKTGSTTYGLEVDYGWQGILAEPSRQWHDELRSNRACAIELDCAWRATGESLTFNSYRNGYRSTISEFDDGLDHAASGDLLEAYEVRTISLLDLLKRHNAPQVIDFMSMDTEGSELAILESFDFSQYAFNALCIEQNFGPDRAGIRALLAQNGYSPIFDHISKVDDWYVPTKTLQA